MPSSALSTSKSLPPGIYKHYKGKRYRVIGIASHTETGEKMVIYQALYGDYGYWVRPLEMWLEMVKIDENKEVPRFRYIEEIEEMDKNS